MYNSEVQSSSGKGRLILMHCKLFQKDTKQKIGANLVFEKHYMWKK